MSLTKPNVDRQAQLAVLNASEIELVDGPDAALAVLAPPTDPVRLHASLGILIRARRFDEAAHLIGDRPPDEKWIHFAAIIFTAIGDNDRALRFVERANESTDPQVIRLTRIAYAEGLVARWQHEYATDSLLSKKDWPSGVAASARRAIDVLNPALAFVQANRGIRGDVDWSAVHNAIYCSHIAGDTVVFDQCVNWLIAYSPISPIVAELCLRGLAPCPKGLATRLRLEHPNDFQALFLAALVERDLCNSYETALDLLFSLASLAIDDTQKETVCITLYETSGRCAPSRVEDALRLVRTLQPDNTRLIGLFSVTRDCIAGHLHEARVALETLRDESDGVWWQAYAQLCEREGNENAAQEAWEQASLLTPHPEVIRRSIQASLVRRRYASAIRGAKSIIATQPNSTKELKTIVWSLMRLRDFDQATTYLERLVSLDPENTEYRISLAQCLARSARPDEAINVLRCLIESDDPPLAAIYLQSELLEAIGEVREAFQLLSTIASNHWDDPDFLVRYMRCGHAAEEDRLASDALARLIELRAGGIVPPELMKEGTLEQLLEYGKEFHRRRESLQSEVVAGRMPWLCAEDVLGNPPMWAWTLHTQDLNWQSEERLTCAAYTIYSTNGFTVCRTTAGRQLNAIRTPAQSTEVVVDLSAILTLSALGLLESVAKYFGTILLPSSYGDLRIRDATRFSRHQPSREEELNSIRGAIDRRKISVVSDESNAIRLVDEYLDDPDRHAYRLRDLVPPLQEANRISTAAVAELQRVAHKEPSADGTHPGLQLGTNVLLDLSTLRTLAGQTAFGNVIDSFSVHLSLEQYDELIRELSAHAAAGHARGKHDAMWIEVSRLIATGAARWVPMAAGADADDEDSDDTLPPQFLDAAQLAKQIGKPLLADDRVMHVLMFQEDDASDSRAFGSDAVLRSLLDSATCTPAQIAVAFRQMMKWRYRFLLPSPILLHRWAEDNIDNLPGDALLDVSDYLQACLRDPGLYCGFEQSDPPMPMAVKFVTSWNEIIVDFLFSIWNSDSFSDSAAITLTRWVGEELVPTIPRGLWLQHIGSNVARVQPTAILSLTMVKFTVLKPRRANLGLVTLARALGLDDDDILTTAVGVINGIT